MGPGLCVEAGWNSSPGLTDHVFPMRNQWLGDLLETKACFLGGFVLVEQGGACEVGFPPKRRELAPRFSCGHVGVVGALELRPKLLQWRMCYCSRPRQLPGSAGSLIPKPS